MSNPLLPALDYAGNTAPLSDYSAFLCIAEDELQLNIGQRFSLPAESQDDANTLLKSISSALEELPSYRNDLGSVVLGVRSLSSPLIDARLQYLAELKRLQREWLKGGSLYNQDWAEYLFDAREKAKVITRRSSQLGQFAYRIIDTDKASALLGRASSGIKPSAYSKVIRHEAKAAIEGAFKSNKNINLATKISGPVAKSLTAISAVVTVAEISVAAADVYAAQGPEQEEEALKRLFETSGEAVGGLVGAGGGAFLCANLTIGTAGIGVVTCGVLTGALATAGQKLGRDLGQSVFSVFGSDALNLVREAKLQ